MWSSRVRRWGAGFGLLTSLLGVIDCSHPQSAAHAETTGVVRAIPIPGATVPLSFDYLAADRASGRIYVPVPAAGALDVLDVSAGTFRRIDGFAMGEEVWRGRKRRTGPSAVTLGEGVAYVGDRGSREVCVVNAAELTLGRCSALPSVPDGLAYVAATREVWVTLPDAKALAVLDASEPEGLLTKATVSLSGTPEGYAVDDARALFFTNVEEEDETLAIDLRSREVRARWKPRCGEGGPRGLAIDTARRLLFVACADHLQVLDMAHDGALRGRLETGAGLDNLDYLPTRGLLFAAAGRAATLTVARAEDDGSLRLVASRPTARGARNAVVDALGTAYVPDPYAGKLLVLR